MSKTAEQEKLEGYPGHRPLNKQIPEPDRNIPPPPRWMGNISTRAYHDLVRTVGPEGMRRMAASGRHPLAAVCNIYEKYRKCRETMEKDGKYFRRFVEVDDG